MKNWILKKKMPIIFTVVGAITGFLYWNYVDCATGSCGITSVWYRTMIYGSIMGWLVGDVINDKFKQSKTKTDERKIN